VPAEAIVMRAPPSRQRGVALVIVIWVTILITVIATSFITERRTEALVVRNSTSIARAAAAADAGVHRALFEGYRNDNSPDVWKRDGTPHDWIFDGIPVRVEMRDESAKIDINTASDALLRGVLLHAGLGEEEANHLLDAILDWRDPDTLKRVNGAEEADYRGAGLTYRPANAPFQAIEELQLVLGMRPDLYRRIAPIITVYSRQVGVNHQIAPREVLLAIPGVTPEIADDYVRRRDEARALNQPVPTLAEAAAYAGGGAMVVNVRSEARLEDGTFFAREALALLRAAPRRPVTFLAWRELTAPRENPDASPNPAPAQAGAR
jgi:general secretion pathway protein K